MWTTHGERRGAVRASRSSEDVFDRVLASPAVLADRPRRSARAGSIRRHRLVDDFLPLLRQRTALCGRAASVASSGPKCSKPGLPAYRSVGRVGCGQAKRRLDPQRVVGNREGNELPCRVLIRSWSRERYCTRGLGLPAMPASPAIIGATPTLPCDLEVLRGQPVGMRPEPHHRGLALVEQVLRRRPSRSAPRLRG